MAETRPLAEIGQDILSAARNELYMHLPYLDAALCALGFRAGDGVTVSLATDGEVLYYNGAYLADRFLRARTLVNRAYMHVVLHCMLRHLAKKQGRDARMWDLACDAAVESILDGLHVPCLEGANSPKRRKFYGECLREMRVLTAEGIYRHLLRQRLTEFELAQLELAFFVDDHGLWAPAERESREQNERQDQRWQSLAEKAQTGMETVLAGQAAGGEAVLEQLRVAAREGVDYRAFLRRFAAPREVMAVDGDAFDYGFYAYGLQIYGNMPLVEPPETKEDRRIEDFVVAVDTSMSTSGELVRQLLACTYAVLRSTETFARRVHIRIMQCDDQLRSDTVIHDNDDLREYMERFTLAGGSATDFRPVFDRVRELQAMGELAKLRGLVYFTDGMGIYPEKRPPYETAFVLLEEPPLSVRVPPWAVRLVLGEDGLGKAVRKGEENNK
ncbi:MAG: hypothetical protein HFH27_02320 [Clostridiaceae bacterium]|nr:hypothetical protein [Clostridiaceae bacterium]NBI80823.1 hypothetical protein [Clostridiaceae bacterium]